MGHRILAWSLWPLGLAVQTSVVVVAGWSDPHSVVSAMGLTSIALILVLVGLEHVLPYWPDWAMRGDRELWRDIGHAMLYTTIGGNVAQLVFLYGFASVLARFGRASGLGLWPVHSFVTPEFHRLHHAIDARQGNSNYATVFPMWDMLFGTHTDPMVAEAHEMGIDHNPIPRQFLSELVSPITWYRLIRKRPQPI